MKAIPKRVLPLCRSYLPLIISILLLASCSKGLPGTKTEAGKYLFVPVVMIYDDKEISDIEFLPKPFDDMGECRAFRDKFLSALYEAPEKPQNRDYIVACMPTPILEKTAPTAPNAATEHKKDTTL